MKAVMQLRGAKRAQSLRLRKHLKFWVAAGYQIVFGTLTFKPEVLDQTSAKTRRRYIQRFLNETFSDYIANIDFGKKNEREHYHFVAVLDISEKLQTCEYRTKSGRKRIKVVSDEILEYETKFGYTLIQPIDKKDYGQVGGYVAKLVNHSIKVKQTKLMVKKDSAYHVAVSVEKAMLRKMNRLGAHYGATRYFDPAFLEEKDQIISEKIYESTLKEALGSVLDALEDKK